MMGQATCEESSIVLRLFLKENPYVYYVYCFAHQLQLALVAVIKKHTKVASLFSLTTHIVNVVGASLKRCDILREKQEVKLSRC